MDPTSLLSNLKRTFSGFGNQSPMAKPASPAPFAIPKPAPFAMPTAGSAPTMGPVAQTSPMQGPAPFIGPRPVSPVIAPPVATATHVAPVVPRTSTGQTINTATGGIVAGSTATTPQVQPVPTYGASVTDSTGRTGEAKFDPNTGLPLTNPTPAVPIVPPSAEQSAVTAAETAYKTAGATTPEQEAAQTEVDRLNESVRAGYEGAGQQAIPMEFITGQQKAIEQRGLRLAEPLTKKLARMEAKRLSGVETSKFALERADKALTSATTAKTAEATAKESARRFGIEQAGTAETRALAEKKFAEDNRQFGLDYAIKQRDIAVKESTAAAAATAKGSTTVAPQKALDQINLVKGSLDKADKLVHASGAGSIQRGVQGLFGASDYTNLIAETNTLRTNVLTMMTDPSIKKFFGPQMSNADVQLMTSAGTTLNPELQSPEYMKTELTRLRDLVTRAESAVKTGNGVGTPTTAPDGRQIIITD